MYFKDESFSKIVAAMVGESRRALVKSVLAHPPWGVPQVVVMGGATDSLWRGTRERLVSREVAACEIGQLQMFHCIA